MKQRDTIYFGGDILTMDPQNPSAQAALVRGEKILAVGSYDECKEMLGEDSLHVDLEGGALVPGFIDTHMHPLLLIYYGLNIDLRGAESFEDIHQRFAEFDAKPGKWLLGMNFDETGLAEKRLPTRHDLDSFCKDYPAIILKHDGHMIIANTCAINEAGLTSQTPDPEGGIIDREEDGFPAGPFRERAMKLVLDKAPAPDLDELATGARRTFKQMLACGITSAGSVLQTGAEGMSGESGAMEVVAMGMLLPESPISFHTLLIASEWEQVGPLLESPLNQGRHKLGGVKLFADGSFGTYTSFMEEPFTDKPAVRGMMTHTEEELYRRMVPAHKAGLQIAIHAIGDAAIGVCVKLFDRLLKEHPRTDHRHRIEHGSVLSESLLRDMKRLGLVISTQPLFIHSEKTWLHKRLGEERAKWTYPFRSILDMGICLVGASDAPVESTSVLHAIGCCVTREGFETQEAISPLEAMRMYTAGAARAQHEEDVKGSITPGKRADLVVLEKNPLKVAPEEIEKIRVLKTIIGGETVYKID